MVYVYCDYQDAAKQTTLNVCGSLLNQALTIISPSARAEIIQELQGQYQMGRSLQLEEMIELLSRTLQDFSKVYVCIDALDECMDECRKQLLFSFAGLLGDPTTANQFGFSLPADPTWGNPFQATCSYTSVFLSV